jgi:aminopeptidase N
VINSSAQNFKTFKNNHFHRSYLTNQADISKIDVLHYDVNIRIKPDEKEIIGNVTITFKVLTDLKNELVFDFIGLETDSVLMTDTNQLFEQENERLKIILTSQIATGDTGSLSIFYQGRPSRGIYFRNNFFGSLVIYSHNEPYDARYWIPCKDIPSDKALLDMFITLPDNYQVLSNGSLVNEGLINSGLKLFHWQEKSPIATYLISIAAAPYERVETTFIDNIYTMPLQYFAYPEHEFRAIQSLELTREMLLFYNEYIGIYPFITEKYAMSEVPFREAAAMENQTCTTMGDFVMDDENIIAHELAHQWWGNALTPASFVDIWLNEGFATYFDALFIEHKYGKESFQQLMSENSSLIYQDGSLEHSIYDPPPAFLFGRAVYYKGAWVLHMLRLKVGDEIFQRIMQTYFNQYIFSNVSTVDFIQVCESISGMNLQKFFDQWVFNAGVPNIFVEWQQTNDQIEVVLEQQQQYLYDLNIELKLKGESLDTVLTIPLNISQKKISVLFRDQLLSVEIDPNHKLLNRNNGPVFFLPDEPKLVNIFPNPFNDEVSILYQIDYLQKIEIEIWNVLGQMVLRLFEGNQTPGLHRYIWQNPGLSSGTYFCLLKTKHNTDVKKILLLK